MVISTIKSISILCCLNLNSWKMNFPVSTTLVIIFMNLLPVHVNGLAGEESLYEALMLNITDATRDVPPPDPILTVYADYQIRSIISVDEQGQKTKTFGWVIVTWRDSRLTWTPADHSGIQFIMVPSDKIWVPPLGFRNSMESDPTALFSTGKVCGVAADGSVRWFPAAPIETSCTVDLTYFPFDKQVCSLRLVSWVYDSSRLFLRCPGPTVSTDFLSANNQWDLADTACKEDLLQLDGFSTARVQFHLYLNRKPLYYIINIFMPSIILAFLSVAIFFIPPGSIAKLNIGFSLFLNFTVFLLRVANVTPRDSDNEPILSIYITIIMVVAAFSVLLSLGLNNIYENGFKSPVPSCLRVFVFNYLARFVCKKTQYNTDIVEPAAGEQQAQGGQRYADGENGKPQINGTENTGIEKVNKSDLAVVMEKLEEMEQGKKEKESEEKKISNEWKEFVRIVERALGIFFATFLTLLTIFLLGVYPATQPAVHPEL